MIDVINPDSGLFWVLFLFVSLDIGRIVSVIVSVIFLHKNHCVPSGYITTLRSISSWWSIPGQGKGTIFIVQLMPRM